MPTSNGAPTRQQIEACSRVFEDLTDPVIVEDLTGCILDMNPEAERAYGYARDDLLGSPIKALVPPEQYELADDLVRQCREREIVRGVESARLTKSGQVKTVLLTLSLLTDEFNEPLAIAAASGRNRNRKSAAPSTSRFQNPQTQAPSRQTTTEH